METRAPYALIGLFVLAAAAAVFGFVYWLHNTGGLGERAIYRVRFETSVSGMLIGSAVLFNGIRVGEVTDLRLMPDDPQKITATIAIDAATPVRADTQAGIEFQGLTGVAVVSLTGGTPSAPKLARSGGEPPEIVADPMAWQTMTQAARTLLRRLDTLVNDNSEPLHGTLSNLNTFSEALARNTNRIDGIIAGLERMTGGGTATATPPIVYDLSAPRTFPASGKERRGQLVIPEPTTVVLFDTQKILVRPKPAESPTFANAQWSDSIPKLLQAKLVQSFENANYLGAVARPVEGLNADYQLLIDIRSFQISTAGDPVADVEFSAKVLGDNRIVNSRIFHAAVPAKLTDAPAAVTALNEAFDKAATELVIWTAGVI